MGHPLQQPSKKSKKDLENEEFEEDDTFEGPWKFMGGLDPYNAGMMRRVMAKIYRVYNPDRTLPDEPKYNVKILTKVQRARVVSMLKEAEDFNPLLTSIHTWFSFHVNEREPAILAAAAFIRTKVVQEIRQPRGYREGHIKAIDMWKAFLLDNNTMGRIFAPDFNAMLSAVDHAQIVKRVMARRKLEARGIFVPTEITMFNSAEDKEDTEPEPEPEEVESEEEVAPKRTKASKKKKKKGAAKKPAPKKAAAKKEPVFNETGISSYKTTRSGKDFRQDLDSDSDDDDILAAVMVKSRLEYEEKVRLEAEEDEKRRVRLRAELLAKWESEDPIPLVIAKDEAEEAVLDAEWKAEKAKLDVEWAKWEVERAERRARDAEWEAEKVRRRQEREAGKTAKSEHRIKAAMEQEIGTLRKTEKELASVSLEEAVVSKRQLKRQRKIAHEAAVEKGKQREEKERLQFEDADELGDSLNELAVSGGKY